MFLGVGSWMGCNSTPARESSGEAREAGSPDILREGAPIQVVEQGYFEYTERGKLVQSLEANRLERWDNPEDEGTSNQKKAVIGVTTVAAAAVLIVVIAFLYRNGRDTGTVETVESV